MVDMRMSYRPLTTGTIICIGPQLLPLNPTAAFELSIPPNDLFLGKSEDIEANPFPGNTGLL